jgi:Ser/Thr protein kinase RdoA (MazF antagonist)
MRDAVVAARERLSRLSFAERPLHGDAHARNALVTADGPVWMDLENICRGPVEYDLASLLFRTRVHGWPAGAEAVAAYGAHDAALVEELLPVVAAFLVPWNATLAAADDPMLQQRIDYLKTFV